MKMYLASVSSIETDLKAESGGLMKAYLAESGGLIFNDANILQSFYYVDDFTRNIIIPNCKDFLLDSGAFTFIQIEISRGATLLLPLGFQDKRFANGIILGVILANLTSSLGLIDVLVGFTIQFTMYYLFPYFIKNKWIHGIAYAVLSGTLVALELLSVLHIPFLYSFVTVGLSGLILYEAGNVLCSKLLKCID